MNERILGATGWERDVPDFRDLTSESDDIGKVLAKSKPLAAARKSLPLIVDLRKWCSPVESQGQLNSCTANAGAGLLEYFERQAFGKHLDASRLFLYKVTRNLLGWTGDQGAYLRTTMKAMVLFGLPPEQYWPYNPANVDVEPPAFNYAFAGNYKTISYFRLDQPGMQTGKLLDKVKQKLAARLPSIFGFTVYSSIPRIGDGTGDIPYPEQGDRLISGHAVMAVGYDDSRKIGKHKGALLIRNSWSTAWGEKGYGWLPYAYVESGLAVDFWSLIKAEFVDTDLFK